MASLKYLLYALTFSLIITLVEAQNQEGFISIDCGSPDEAGYVDNTTGLAYLSDLEFTRSGQNADVSAESKLQVEKDKQLWNLRSFPEGERNCYSLVTSLGNDTKYLLRARFFYGNYDNKTLNPAFALYLGVDLWDIVDISDASEVQTKEIIFAPSSDYVHVCLVNTGNGVPFISSLELRPLHDGVYPIREGTGLQLARRDDFTSNSTNPYMRYKDDVYDRIWFPFSADVWEPISKFDGQDDVSENLYRVPNTVMSTAYTRNVSISYMGFVWTPENNSARYLFYIHFAELVKLENNDSRAFDIFINDKLWYGPFAPTYLASTTIFSTTGSKPDSDGKITVWFNKTANSTLPPLVNAMEIYELKELSQLQTFQTDLEAILNMKNEYGLKRGSWQGDPCAPKDFLWDGLNCSHNPNPPRITSLNLSSSGLEGEISSSIAGLTMLEYLDLSNNTLSGTVPEFLADLTFLRVLNLKGNKLEGPVPATLLERSRNGLLLSVDASVRGNVSTPSPFNETSMSSTAYGLEKSKFVSIAASFAGCLLYFVI